MRWFEPSTCRCISQPTGSFKVGETYIYTKFGTEGWCEFRTLKREFIQNMDSVRFSKYFVDLAEERDLKLGSLLEL